MHNENTNTANESTIACQQNCPIYFNENHQVQQVSLKAPDNSTYIYVDSTSFNNNQYFYDSSTSFNAQTNHLQMNSNFNQVQKSNESTNQEQFNQINAPFNCDTSSLPSYNPSYFNQQQVNQYNHFEPVYSSNVTPSKL